jgi:hypothetical protein
MCSAQRTPVHFGEWSPRAGFIVTNLETDGQAVVRFYNKRGTAEQWIQEGRQAVKMTRLSCYWFRSKGAKTAPGKNLHFGGSEVDGLVYHNWKLGAKMEIPSHK